MKKMSLYAWLVTMVCGFAFLWFYFKRGPAHPSAELANLGQISEFTLTDQNGETFASPSLHGKVWLVNFMFTRCKGPCPRMTQKISELAQRHQVPEQNEGGLKGARQPPEQKVHIVSITMDPKNDTSEVLKAYGQQFSADFSQWHFLTGQLDDIINISRSAFRLPAGQDPNMHSTRVVLIDQMAAIRGFYDSADDAALKQLEADITRLTSSPTT